jgi:putative two-component system response regulator
MGSAHIETLEALLRNATIASDPRLRLALRKLQSELANRGTRSSVESTDFYLAAVQALRKIKGHSYSEIRWHCLRECCAFFFHHGYAEDALDAANQQFVLAPTMQSPSAACAALNSMGVICADLGDIQEALGHYSAALDIAQTHQDHEQESVVLNNLGTALNYAGLYREAIPCFEQVVRVTRPSWQRRVDLKALSNMAQSLYYLEEFPMALDAITRCMAASPRPTSAIQCFERTIREFTFVQIALEVGDYALANDRANLCRQYANSANSHRCQIMANIALARCDVRAGKVAYGLSSLERTLVESRDVDSGYRDVLVALVKAYDDASLPETALIYLERLLAHVRAHRTRSLEALLALSTRHTVSSPGTTTYNDLRAFECKRAELRAQVAERAINDSRREMLERLAATADLKDDASGGHGYRVGKLSAQLAKQIGWSGKTAAALDLAARLHDIGKIAIPDRVLGSSNSLKQAERHFMSMHAVIGFELLRKSDTPEIEIAERIARHHHEWWNGDGYPDSLKALRIPVEARIVALADVFDSLTHGRPYSPPWDFDRAVCEIKGKRGKQFDPLLTDAFVSLVTSLKERGELNATVTADTIGAQFMDARARIRKMLAFENDRLGSSEMHT